jgi:hypothetical protein
VSAERIGDLSRALSYAEGAVEEPELRLAALERVRRLALAFGDVEKQRQALRQLVAHQSGDLRLEASKDLAGSLLASPEPAHRDEGRRVLEAALADAPRGRAVTDEIRAWLERLDADAVSESPAPTEVVAEPEPEPPPSRATMPQGLLVGIAAPTEARTEGTALGLESSDPFPEGAYTARDPFPSAPPPPVEPGRASADGAVPVAPSEIDVEAELAGAEASGSILRAERIAEVFAKGRPDVAMRARRLAAELAPGTRAVSTCSRAPPPPTTTLRTSGLSSTFRRRCSGLRARSRRLSRIKSNSPACSPSSRARGAILSWKPLESFGNIRRAR